MTRMLGILLSDVKYFITPDGIPEAWRRNGGGYVGKLRMGWIERDEWMCGRLGKGMNDDDGGGREVG